MTNPDYYTNYYIASLKAAMLKCQWEKNYCKAKKKCEMCWHKFECLTMMAKRYMLTESSTVWRVYEVFAEDKDDAEKTLDYWYTDIARLIDEDSETNNYEIEESIPSLAEEEYHQEEQ